MNIDELYDIISQNVQFYRMNNLKYGHITKEKLSKLSEVNIRIIKNIEERKKGLVISLTALNHIARALDITLYKFFMKRKVKRM